MLVAEARQEAERALHRVERAERDAGGDGPFDPVNREALVEAADDALRARDVHEHSPHRAPGQRAVLLCTTCSHQH